MKTLIPLLTILLVSCSAPFHLNEMYDPKTGHLVKREIDVNPSIGGVHSQKGADGYQADDDNQKSLADSWNGLGVYSGFKYGAQTQASNNTKDISLAKETTKQQGQTLTAASTDLKTTTDAATRTAILNKTGKGPPGKNFPAPAKATVAPTTTP